MTKPSDDGAGFKELTSMMEEPQAHLKGTVGWIDRHQEKDLILQVIGEYLKRRRTGKTNWSFPTFVDRILKKRFKYPFDHGAFKAYVKRYHRAR